ncbi:MAG: PAS domain-containing protein [Candidatus Omnitrophica bacterium]|nr:PAS domain-containing protein [Candidatus Omnitrophota bacterium]
MGIITRVNQESCRLLDYKENELIGKNINTIFPGLDVSIDKEEKIFNYESQCIKKDGTAITALISSSVLNKTKCLYGRLSSECSNFVLNGCHCKEAQGIVIVAKDITDKKKSEKNLLSEIKFSQDSVDAISDIFYVFDTKGKFIRWNRALSVISKYSNEEIKGMNPADFFDEEGAKMMSQAIETAFKNGHAEMEADLITKDKEIIPMFFSGSLMKNSDGEPLLCGIGKNISTQRRNQSLIKENEARLSLALKGSESGLWDWNILTGEYKFDEVWSTMLGYSLDELLPHISTWEKLVHPDDEAMVKKELAHHFKDEKYDFDVDFRMRCKDGNWKWIHASGKVFEQSSHGAPARMIGTHVDITGKKQSRLEIEGKNLALEKINKELQVNEKVMKMLLDDVSKTNEKLKDAHRQIIQSEKLASIGQLAAGIAHEINNPLGFITSNISTLEQYIGGFSEILRVYETLKNAIKKEDIEKSKKIEKEIQELEKRLDIEFIIGDIDSLLRETTEGLERIRKIVIDLKTFSRENGEDKNLADINGILKSVLNIVKNELKYKAEVEQDYGDIPQVNCNSQKVGQVFINLLINAAHAIEKKGIIKIKTYSKDNKVFVDIIDNGKGIPVEDHKKIFDAFYTTKKTGEGTGLGLSISYDIVRSHEGDILLESEPGKGAKFTVVFPACK